MDWGEPDGVMAGKRTRLSSRVLFPARGRGGSQGERELTIGDPCGTLSPPCWDLRPVYRGAARRGDGGDRVFCHLEWIRHRDIGYEIRGIMVHPDT